MFDNIMEVARLQGNSAILPGFASDHFIITIFSEQNALKKLHDKMIRNKFLRGSPKYLPSMFVWTKKSGFKGPAKMTDGRL